MSKKTAIYALSADPITYGHLNIIERASNQFDKLIVAIGNNPDKNYMLTLAERVNIAEIATSQYKNVVVKSFEGLLVDFAYIENANIIIRGLRDTKDFVFEQKLNDINISISKEHKIETFYLLSEQSQFLLSSSASKMITKEHVFAHDYLPLASKMFTECRINGQFIMGVTGLMGSGKSYISQSLEDLSKKNPDDVQIHNIDLDYLAHQVYTSEDSCFVAARKQIESIFGTLDRAVIGTQIFEDPDKLAELNLIFKKPLDFLIRNSIKNLKGIILLNGATLLANGYLSHCNNTVLFVDSTDDLRFQRCKDGRNIEKDVVENRNRVMITRNKQIEIIESKIKNDNFGKLFIFDNNESCDKNITNLYNDILIYSKSILK